MPKESPGHDINPEEWEIPDHVKSSLNDWFEKYGDRIRCPICNIKLDLVSEYFVSVPIFIPGKGTSFGPVYTFFMVTCASCGYTHFINAVTTGIITGSGEESGDD